MKDYNSDGLNRTIKWSLKGVCRKWQSTDRKCAVRFLGLRPSASEITWDKHIKTSENRHSNMKISFKTHRRDIENATTK